ncbi:ankyrin repeat protein [Colletotrichum chrysophilum]|uniref:Ankyrin repeat protein n=1 Tax=Colletotrichum chrysophilum TaxID=1836956 RepID=A0AAD9EKW1_9PEZI|nr:ankyrin repeat protein [Colletotrichum chrysophilum]
MNFFDMPSSSENILRDMIQGTRHWSSVLRHRRVVDMLQAALHSKNIAFADLLLSKGFEWLLGKLIDRGLDPNMRIDSYPHRTAIVDYVLNRMPAPAAAIFRNGGDPFLADCNGLDGALAAAYRNSVSFLDDIAVNSASPYKDWHRTCYMNILDSEPAVFWGWLNALHLGAASGSDDVLRFYLENNLLEDVNAKADANITPLHVATINGHVSTVVYLCSRGCNVNACGVYESSPLHFAARAGRLNLARVLFHAGCRPSRDATGFLPSFYAPNDNKHLSEWLMSIEAEAKPAQNMPLLAEAAHRSPYRAFANLCQKAIEDNNSQILETLRNAGYNFEMPLGSCGCSALIQAIEMGRSSIVRWLLQNQADITREVCHSASRISAMHLVIRKHNLNEVLRQCLECYAVGGGHFTEARPGFLETAVRAGNVDGLEILLGALKNNLEVRQ